MSDRAKKEFWDLVQHCDPRILYALFGIVVVLFEFVRPDLPVPVPPSVMMLYDRVENMATNELVIIDSGLAAGTRAECQGQYESFVRHLFSRNIKFAVTTWVQFVEGQKLALQFAENVAGEMGKEYGKDYCVLQAMSLSGGATLQSFAKDIPGAVKADINNTPLSEIPFMKNVRDINDVALVYTVNYAWDAVPWIAFVQAVYGTPLAVGSAGITSSTAYPFLDSGQLCGVLAGAAGAAAYETLVHRAGMGTKTVSLQSFATLYVVAAIVLGNVAMFMAHMTGRGRGL